MYLRKYNITSYGLPPSNIVTNSFLQHSSSLSLSWATDFPRSSKLWEELNVILGKSAYSRGAETDWKLYKEEQNNCQLTYELKWIILNNTEELWHMMISGFKQHYATILNDLSQSKWVYE